MKCEIYKREGKRHSINMIRTGWANDYRVGEYFDTLVTQPYWGHTCPKWGDMIEHKLSVQAEIGVDDIEWHIEDWCDEDKELPAALKSWVREALNYALGQVDPGSWNEAFIRKSLAVLEGKEGWTA